MPTKRPIQGKLKPSIRACLLIIEALLLAVGKCVYAPRRTVSKQAELTGPTTPNPEIPKKTPRLHELLKKFTRTFAFFPVT